MFTFDVCCCQSCINSDANAENGSEFICIAIDTMLNFDGDANINVKCEHAFCRAIKQGMVFRIHVGIYSNEDTMAHTRRLVVTS